MPKEIFPECCEAYEAAGTVNKECAEQTGLKEGIKIAYGGGDTLMQGVGNGIIRPGVLQRTSERPVRSREDLTNHYMMKNSGPIHSVM